jgi:hypothetical protein
MIEVIAQIIIGLGIIGVIGALLTLIASLAFLF